MMKKSVLLLFLLVMTTHMTAQNASQRVTLKLIETSDVHGSFFPYDFIAKEPTDGSLARVSAYVNQLRQQDPEGVVLVDNGDILQGQPTCYYYNYIGTSVPNLTARIVNYLQYDAQTMGNHDVETGHTVYDKWIKETNCPILGANIVETATGRPYVFPYTIVERKGVRIAVIGMLTPAIPNWLHESLYQGLHFEEMVSCARRWVDDLRTHEHPDVIVGLFHSGWEGGITTPQYMEDATRFVAEQVPEFDVIFFGHDHMEHQIMTDNGVLCLDPSCYAKKVAQATLELEQQANGRWKVVKKTGELVDVRQTVIDERYMAHFQPDIDQITTYVNRRIGRFESAISTRD